MTAAEGAGVLEAASADYVKELEAAYEEAAVAVEAFVTAVDRVQEVRARESVWRQANRLGIAPARPESWDVRVTRDEELQKLNNRFGRAVNTRW
jgi:hypothetical protein